VPQNQLPLMAEAHVATTPKRKRHRRKKGTPNQVVQFPTDEVKQRKAN
jgi:hypothetical protein